MRSFNVLLLLFTLFGVTGCQERDGTCPDVQNIEPSRQNANETVTITGRNFALNHDDLWDDGPAWGPEVSFLVSIRDSVADFEVLFTEEELAELEAMDMTLLSQSVVFRSSEELEVTLPDLTWDDMMTTAELFGSELPDIPSSIDSFPLVSQVTVKNPAGCEDRWDGDFELVVIIETDGDGDADGDGDGDADGDGDSDADADEDM